MPFMSICRVSYNVGKHRSNHKNWTHPMMMKKLAITLLLVLSLPVMASGSYQERLNAAHRYLEVITPESFWQTMTDNMTDYYSKKQIQQIKQAGNIERLENRLALVMADVFTVEELNAITSFYGSRTGKSIMKKANGSEYNQAFSKEILEEFEAAKKQAGITQ